MSKQQPLPNLIAWLSLVSFTAGMSQLAVPQANYVWIIGGLFGLISSVGLDVARRQREKQTEPQAQRQLDVAS